MLCLTVCPPIAVYDDLSHPLVTYLGTQYHIVQQMALITIFVIWRWARPTSSIHTAYSKHMLSYATCSLMLVLCLIHFSSVKRFRPPVIFDFHPQLMDMVSVCQASNQTFQLHVFLCSSCCPYVCFISFFCPYWPVLISLLKSVFWTSHMDMTINKTSSYVDLAPLYSNNEETLNKIYVCNGQGLLPDMFVEDQLLLPPPAVSILLVLFSHNHNIHFWLL